MGHFPIEIPVLAIPAVLAVDYVTNIVTGATVT
jgi:hypothetical protein